MTKLKKNYDRGIKKILTTAVLALFAIVMIVPVVWMASTSLKFESAVFNFPIEWIPKEITLDNYKKAFTKVPYFNWYFNTLRNTSIIVISTLIVASMSGFAFAKVHFKGRNVIFLLYISALMVPGEMRLIPQYMLYKKIGILNTSLPVLLPWMLFTGFSIFFMRQSFTSVPDEMVDAANIDGCGFFRIYYNICLPLVRSSLVALGILSFTWGWNDYLSPLIYIQESVKQVLSVGIASFKAQYASNYAMQMAGATVALVPVITVYFIAQKYFIEGIAQTGIKG